MVSRDVILLGISLTIISLLFGVYLYEIQPVKGILLKAFLKSEEQPATLSNQGIYEVKYSEEEAKDWVYIGTMSAILYPGESSTKYISWQRDYPSKLKLDISVNINSPQYYSCSWYECVDCSLYSYQYCSQYKCTVQAGTPYAICERDEITQWKCVLSASQTISKNKTVFKEAEVKDGPDIADWWDPDYIEIVLNSYPYDLLLEEGETLVDYYIYLEFFEPIDCLSTVKIKVFYSDGTSDEFNWYFIVDKDWGITYGFLPSTKIANKEIYRIEIWEKDIDFKNCFSTGDSLVVKVRYAATVKKTTEDVQYVNKEQKEQLEQQGYTCTPYNTVTTTKTFTGITSCDVVQYTTDKSKDGRCENGVCYWYCNPEYECTPTPPRTKESGTHTETITYTASTKQELYNKGCSDAEISCISWDTKTGTLSDYQNDVLYKDAKNPSCSQWSYNVYKSTTDKTKLSGEPPYTQCTYKSTVSEKTIEDAICTGPFQDTISEPAKLEIGALSKTYYSSTHDTIYLDINARETVYISLKGAEFTNVPNKGVTTFTIGVEALDINPYIVSQSAEDITPEGATYKAKKYTATIYSPGDLIAKFYPPVCSDFEAEDLKYRYASIDGNTLSGDPCSEGGILLYLHKGNNRFEMVGYSIDPSRFESCTKKPNTCEEEDLYGCPEQCKAKNLQLSCPSTLTISAGLGKEVTIPITVTAGSEGIIKLSIEGEGVVFIPQEHKINIGTNPIPLKATYYLETKESKKVIWRIVAENPAIRGYPKIKPEYVYCEIRVTVIPPGLIDILKRPEVIISFIVIIIGLILLLTGKKPKPK